MFQEIDCYDELTIETTDQPGWRLTCSDSAVPCDESNILTRIYNAFSDRVPSGLQIHLDKQIPLGAGLGGASGNAAGFLKWLNDTFSWGYDADQLCEIGVRFGADAPFFIRGGTAIVQGIGEMITPLSQSKYSYFVLVNPRIHVSTRDVFQAYDRFTQFQRDDGDIDPGLSTGIVGPNDLQAVVCDLLPEYRNILAVAPALQLTGSGATLFMPCDSQAEADEHVTMFQERWPAFWVRSVRALVPV